jgi:hypothetical protein
MCVEAQTLIRRVISIAEHAGSFAEIAATTGVFVIVVLDVFAWATLAFETNAVLRRQAVVAAVLAVRDTDSAACDAERRRLHFDFWRVIFECVFGFDEEVGGYVDDRSEARVSGRREAIRISICDVTAGAWDVMSLEELEDVFTVVKDLHLEAKHIPRWVFRWADA